MTNELSRRLLLAAGLAAPLPAWAADKPLAFSGAAVQGGTLIGRTRPGALVALDGEQVGETSPGGYFVIGFDRDAPASTTLAVSKGAWREAEIIEVAPGSFDIQRIDGLPADQVAPQDPALLERIAREAQRKADGFASRAPLDDFRSGFVMPLAATRISSSFGGQRILNGQPSRPHYGADFAAPVGTPVHAPAGGLVSFAETGLHFEGGLVLLDHGQGLVSAYLHLSKVMVEKGQRVARGEPIGLVGQEGRATGPHLCWRMKWRGRNLDPTLLVGVASPRL